MPFFFMGAGSAFFAGAVVVVVVVVVVFDVSTAGFMLSDMAGAGAAAGVVVVVVVVSAGASFFAHAMSPRTATARNKRFIESPFKHEFHQRITHRGPCAAAAGLNRRKSYPNPAFCQGLGRFHLR
jgi:hypothetical protein